MNSICITSGIILSLITTIPFVFVYDDLLLRTIYQTVSLMSIMISVINMHIFPHLFSNIGKFYLYILPFFGYIVLWFPTFLDWDDVWIGTLPYIDFVFLILYSISVAFIRRE